MPRDLRVMSFNIRNGEADDGANSWPFRHELTFQTIRDFAPDIFGLQEVFDFQLRSIEAAFPGFGRVGQGREDGVEAGEFAPIFFDRSRFELVETTTFWLSETPQVPGSMSWATACTRICTSAHLREIGGPEFEVMNLHLDHESQLARERGVALALSRIGTLPTILMGDFNAGPREPEIRQIEAFGLVDTHLALHPGEPNAGTFHAFDPDSKLGDRIDYIFVTPTTRVLNSEIVQAQNGGRYPSDHFPVGATISLSLAS